MARNDAWCVGRNTPGTKQAVEKKRPRHVISPLSSEQGTGILYFVA